MSLEKEKKWAHWGYFVLVVMYITILNLLGFTEMGLKFLYVLYDLVQPVEASTVIEYTSKWGQPQ